MKRVAVTGSSGFVGGALANQLHTRGFEVRGGYLSHEPHGTFDFVQADLCDRTAAERLIAGCDTVFHTAALVGTLVYKRQNPATIASQNVASTLNVLEAAVRSGAERVVFISSTEVYLGDGPFLEVSGLDGLPAVDNDGYVWSKRFAEVALGLFSRQHGLGASILRLDNVYGAGEPSEGPHVRAIPAMIRRALAGEDLVIWGDGKQRRSFLYIDDVVDAIIASASLTGSDGPINLSSPESVTIGGLARLILELTQATSKLVVDPARPGGPPDRPVDIAKAQRLLGFRPKVALRDGIARSIAALTHGATT